METYLGENYKLEKIADAIFEIQKYICGGNQSLIVKEIEKSTPVKESNNPFTGVFENGTLIESKNELILQVNSNPSGIKIEGSLDNKEFFLIQIQNCASGSVTPGTIATEIKGIFKLTTSIPFVKLSGKDCSGVYYCNSRL